MPKRLYYVDSSLLEHSARVAEINGNSVVLDETIFHPQGGGQPSDLGTINDIPVIQVIDHGEEAAIEHVLKEQPNFKVGEMVELRVEKEPRLLFTRLHSGGHLLAHVAENAYKNLSNPRGHHLPGEARVQFDYSGDLPSKEEIGATLLGLMKKAISSDTPVVSEWTPETGRFITFTGFGRSPCGGTHVKALGEIGEFSFRKVEAKKGVLKLSYNIC